MSELLHALTVCQPYAHLIATGEKRVENRTWPTGYRGPLLIHAGRSRAWMNTHGGPLPEDLVFGAVLAVVDLTACVRYDHRDLPGWSWLETDPHASGPFCWILDRPRPLAEPIPCRGRQGLWRPSEKTFDALAAQGVIESP